MNAKDLDMHTPKLRVRQLFVRLISISVLVLAAHVAAGGTAQEEAFWQAAREGDVTTLKSLLADGMPVDVKTEFDCTALYFAASSNRTEAMHVLLKAGADVNVRDNSYGFTAISMASWLGHAEAVQVLLDAEANRDDAIGGLYAATGNGHLETVDALLKSLKLEAEQLTGVLATAQRAGHDDLVQRLEAAGAKAPEPDPETQAAAETAEASQAESSQAETTQATDNASSVGAAESKAAKTAVATETSPIQVSHPAPWPEFRGKDRSGTADGQLPPLTWDLETGRNVRWRTPVPGLGLSSPVIWDGTIYITTSVSPETEQTVEAGDLGNIDAVDETQPHQWQVMAYSLHSGEQLWQHTATTGVPRSKRHWKASQANPTAATDGEVVITSFGSQGLFAYDVQGKLLWQQDLGELNSGWYLDAAFEWGYASSPILDGDRVIVQVDIHGESFVAAFDRKTGKSLWRTQRDELPSWGTPLVYRGKDHSELVLVASKATIGYEPATGKERWRLLGNSTITVASPIAQDGLIIATGGYRTPKPIYAIRPGAQDDITPELDGSNQNVAWSRQTDGAYNVTPLLYRGQLYVLRDNGALKVFDASSGEQLLQQRVRGRYTASPVAADGRVYFTAEDGDVTVLRAGRSGEILAENSLDASTLTTPAISDGVMVFRTVKELVGLGTPRP